MVTEGERREVAGPRGSVAALVTKSAALLFHGNWREKPGVKSGNFFAGEEISRLARGAPGR
jgi:hypothetical protein